MLHCAGAHALTLKPLPPKDYQSAARPPASPRRPVCGSPPVLAADIPRTLAKNVVQDGSPCRRLVLAEQQGSVQSWCDVEQKGVDPGHARTDHPSCSTSTPNRLDDIFAKLTCDYAKGRETTDPSLRDMLQGEERERQMSVQYGTPWRIRGLWRQEFLDDNPDIQNRLDWQRARHGYEQMESRCDRYLLQSRLTNVHGQNKRDDEVRRQPTKETGASWVKRLLRAVPLPMFTACTEPEFDHVLLP